MCRILPVLGFVWGRRAGRYTSWSSVNIHPGELKLPQKSIFVRATIWVFFWFFFLIFERDVDLLSNTSHQVILISAPVNHRYSPGLLLLNVTSLLLICHLSHHGLFPNHHRLTPKPTNTHSPLQEGFFLFFFFFSETDLCKENCVNIHNKALLERTPSFPPVSLLWTKWEFGWDKWTCVREPLSYRWHQSCKEMSVREISEFLLYNNFETWRNYNSNRNREFFRFNFQEAIRDFFFWYNSQSFPTQLW